MLYTNAIETNILSCASTMLRLKNDMHKELPEVFPMYILVDRGLENSTRYLVTPKIS